MQQVVDGNPTHVGTELIDFLFDCLDYGVLIGKPCKYGMYPEEEEEWLLTSEGHVFVEHYTLYDQSKYCMDIFYNKSEFNHSFTLFVCFDNPATKQVSIR